VTFLEFIKTYFIDKPVTFSGRACPVEFLLLVVSLMGLSILLLTITDLNVVDPESLEYPNIVLRALVVKWIGILFLFISFLSLGIRRLHDINRSGWWLLINFIPFVGWSVFLYWMIKKGTSGPNRFGENPLQKNGIFLSRLLLLMVVLSLLIELFDFVFR
jgi:uncharacterized membrane protein YhaH (DUF805 family)